jgi:hypothetical protein
MVRDLPGLQRVWSRTEWAIRAKGIEEDFMASTVADQVAPGPVTA